VSWLWVAAFALACASGSRAQDAQGVRTNGVRGVVVDENGSPVVDATLTLSAQSQVIGARTDADGHFDFSYEYPHGFTLRVVAEGFGRFERSWKEGEWNGASLRVVLYPPSLSERVTVTA